MVAWSASWRLLDAAPIDIGSAVESVDSASDGVNVGAVSSTNDGAVAKSGTKAIS